MIVGVDGNPTGWSAAGITASGELKLESFRQISDVFDAWEIDILAIDMIIGLPESAVKGGRIAERQARKLLSPRGSVVFSAPCRGSVYASSYEQALEYSRQSSPDGIGLSKQSYNISPKIRELDLFLRAHADRQSRVFEVHPELSFWEMNHRVALPSKHSKAGISKRKELLNDHNLLPKRSVDVDMLDALACLFSARRMLRGESEAVPDEILQDDFGLRMQISW